MISSEDLAATLAAAKEEQATEANNPDKPLSTLREEFLRLLARHEQNHSLTELSAPIQTAIETLKTALDASTDQEEQCEALLACYNTMNSPNMRDFSTWELNNILKKLLTQYFLRHIYQPECSVITTRYAPSTPVVQLTDIGLRSSDVHYSLDTKQFSLQTTPKPNQEDHTGVAQAIIDPSLSTEEITDAFYQAGIALGKRIHGLQHRHHADIVSYYRHTAGSTLVSSLLHRTAAGLTITTLSAGDSRAMLVQKQADSSYQAQRLSITHQPHLPREQARLHALRDDPTIKDKRQISEHALTKSLRSKRIEGRDLQLAVSRAVGDYDVDPSNRIVTSHPEITQCQLAADSEGFVILGSDGIFADNLLAEADVAAICAQTNDPEQIAKTIDSYAHAFQPRDNMSVIVAPLSAVPVDGHLVLTETDGHGVREKPWLPAEPPIPLIHPAELIQQQLVAVDFSRELAIKNWLHPIYTKLEHLDTDSEKYAFLLREYLELAAKLRQQCLTCMSNDALQRRIAEINADQNWQQERDRVLTIIAHYDAWQSSVAERLAPLAQTLQQPLFQSPSQSIKDYAQTITETHQQFQHLIYHALLEDHTTTSLEQRFKKIDQGEIGKTLRNTTKLITDITNPDHTPIQKRTTISHYANACYPTQNTTLLKLAATIALTSLAIVVGAGVGAVIGMAMGIWAGPADILLTLAGAVKGAISAAEIALLVGVGSEATVATTVGLLYSGYSLFSLAKPPSPLTQTCRHIAHQSGTVVDNDSRPSAARVN